MQLMKQKGKGKNKMVLPWNHVGCSVKKKLTRLCHFEDVLLQESGTSRVGGDFLDS